MLIFLLFAIFFHMFHFLRLFCLFLSLFCLLSVSACVTKRSEKTISFCHFHILFIHYTKCSQFKRKYMRCDRMRVFENGSTNLCKCFECVCAFVCMFVLHIPMPAYLIKLLLGFICHLQQIR